MFGFVEKWLANIIEVKYEPFILNDGSEAAILDKEEFLYVFNILNDLHLKNSDEENIRPEIFNSDIRGLKVIVHKYYSNYDVLNGLVGGDVKSDPKYLSIMMMNTPRFNFEEFQDDIKNIIIEYKGKLEEASEIKAVERTDEDQKKKEEPQLTNKEKFFLLLKETFSFNKTHNSPSGENKITFINADFIPEFIEFSDSINKNIFVFNRVKDLKILLSIKKRFKLSDVYEHSLIIINAPIDNPNFSRPSVAGKKSICFGEEIINLYSLINMNYDSTIQNIKDDEFLSQEEKKKRIKKIESQKGLNMYSKYDSIFKDSKTNIVWAIKDRCFLYMLFNIEDNEKAYKKCLKELGRRFYGTIPLSELKKIDEVYYKEIAEKDKDNYINFAIESSKKLINEIKKKYNMEKDLFNSHMEKAMEHGKLSSICKEQINAFNEEDYTVEQKIKALSAYDQTKKIPGVLSIFIDGDVIHVYTKNIYAQDERTKKWHDIGTFHIFINMYNNKYDTDNTVKIMNTKHQIIGIESNMQAPHVFSDGHICHGSLASRMIGAYAKRDLFELVYSIILFLGDANTNDIAGAYISNWPEVTEEFALNALAYKDEEDYIEEKSEVDVAFDNMLAEAIPVNIE